MARAASLLSSALRRAAREARANRDWPELLAQATRLQQDSPDEPDGYLWAITAMRRLNQHAELERSVTEALQRFPDHPKLLAMQSGKPLASTALDALRAELKQAIRKPDWKAAASFAARLRGKAPDDPRGYQTGARALRALKRMKQADALSRHGVEKFPTHTGLLLERAMILQAHKRLGEALSCYAMLRELRPDTASSYTRPATVLMRQRRFDEAEVMLQSGLDRIGPDVGLLVQRAIAAGRRSDFLLARSRWEDLRKRAPDDPRLARYAGDLTRAEQLHTISAGAEAEPS